MAGGPARLIPARSAARKRIARPEVRIRPPEAKEPANHSGQITATQAITLHQVAQQDGGRETITSRPKKRTA
jgi:hypothetical protein